MIPRLSAWLWPVLGLVCLGSLALATPSWAAIYRCTDTSGREVFSNRPCPGGTVVVPDRLPPTPRVAPARPGRGTSEPPPVPTGPLPDAWEALPERGQCLCLRDPARCARLRGGVQP